MFADIDGDGNKEEKMKDAAKDKKDNSDSGEESEDESDVVKGGSSGGEAQKGGSSGDAEDVEKQKNESVKITTPEQEQALYENRFGSRNNRLFQKLVQEWIK